MTVAETRTGRPLAPSGHRGFVAAMAIDSVAAGVFQPAAMLYLLATSDLSLAAIGTALTVGGVAALPVGLWGGQWVDRIGPRPVLMAANVAQAAGMVGYLAFHSFWLIALASWVSTAGRSVFFGSFGVAVSAIAGEGERERWFGFLGGVRNLGQAAGGLVAGVAVGVGSPAAYTAVIVITAASFLGAVPLMRGIPRPVPHGTTAPTAPWRTVLRDRGYRRIVGYWIAYAVSAYVLGLAVPVYAAVTLDLPGWVAGAMFTLNTVLIGFGQTRLIRRLEGRVRSHLLVGSQVVFAAGYLVLFGASLSEGAVAIGIIAVGVVAYTFAEGIGYPVLSALSAEAAPAALRGRYLALFQLAGSGVGALAPFLLSGLLSLGAGVLWFGLVGICGVGVLLALACGAAVPAASRRVGTP